MMKKMIKKELITNKKELMGMNKELDTNDKYEEPKKCLRVETRTQKWHSLAK